MNVLSFIISVFLIMILISNGKTNDILGPFTCSFFGNIEFFCQQPNIPAKDLPTECSSFFWDFMIFGSDHFTLDDVIQDIFNTYDKPVIIISLHSTSTYFDYLNVDINKQALDDIAFLPTYTHDNPKIKGLLFNDIDLKMYTGKFDKFADNLNTYLSEFKKKFPCMVFGVVFDAGTVIDLFSKGNEGFDINKLDKSLDFILLKFSIFNPCTKEIIKGGTIPLGGNLPHTLEKLKVAMDHLKLPKTKVYFKYQFYGIKPKLEKLVLEELCFTSYQMMCQKPEESKDWCADTSGTLAEKGKFAKENGAGINADMIDLDDATSACKCKKKFPAFYYILDGWNNEKPEACPLFDR